MVFKIEKTNRQSAHAICAYDSKRGGPAPFERSPKARLVGESTFNLAKCATFGPPPRPSRGCSAAVSRLVSTTRQGAVRAPERLSRPDALTASSAQTNSAEDRAGCTDARFPRRRGYCTNVPCVCVCVRERGRSQLRG
eukprot:6179854-Pleurochrysis_carterae.AAC.1